MNERIECPWCDSKKINEEDDKDKVLYTIGFGQKIYAKKYVCTECGYEWSK